MVKKLPANTRDVEMRVPSLSQEDPLEKGMATHSSILAGRIPWAEVTTGCKINASQSVVLLSMST